MRLSKLAWSLGMTIALAGAPAWGGDEAKPGAPAEAAPAEDQASAEVKAGTGILRKKRVLVGEADAFAPGTKVWVWSRVHHHKGETFKHVWKRDGKTVMEKEYTATSSHYRTWTASRARAGSYVVEVVSAGGEILGSVAFEVGDRPPNHGTEAP